MYFETNYAYGNIYYVEIPTVRLSTRIHCIYQNLDNICCFYFFSLSVRRKFRPYEWNHERSSLMNWELQDRIKATLERIATRRKISKTLHYTRLTNSQKFDSSLSTWYRGDCGQIYLCVILADGENSSEKPRKSDETLKRPVFKP